MSYIPSNMNRSRAKIDKENENKNIWKKLKHVQPRVHSNLLYNPTSISVEKSGNLSAKHSARPTVISKTSNLVTGAERRVSPSSTSTRTPMHSPRRQKADDDSTIYMKNLSTVSQTKPLSMYMASSFGQKPRLSNRPKKTKGKKSILPAISDNEPVEEMDNSSRSSKSLQDLYTPRNGQSLSSSSSDAQNRAMNSSFPQTTNSLKDETMNSTQSTARSEAIMLSPKLDLISLSSGSSTYLNLDLDLCSLPSPSSHDDIFHMAPLIPAPSATQQKYSPTKLDTSATLIRQFRNVLQQEERTMPDADINVVKNVLKTDERVNFLKTQEADPKLFKDILKTQLEEIVKNEKVVKNALRMLGASTHVVETARPIEVINVTPVHRKCCHKTCKKLKGRQSTDSSPRGNSSFDIDDAYYSGKQRDAATDTLSIKDFTPRQEIINAYANEKGTRKSRYTKLMTAHTAPQAEFEEFIKGTLPLKRRGNTMNKGMHQQVAFMQQPAQDDLQVNIVRGAFKERAEMLRAKEAGRPQVDVTFKNVPSLEKEILILKALGERLEATLKRSLSEPSLSDQGEKFEKHEKLALPSCGSNSSLFKELKRIDSSIEVFPGRRVTIKPLRCSMCVMLGRTSACSVIFSKGLRHEIGIVNEFVIVAKTIDELLNDSNSSFYIPKENEPAALEPISFKQLAEQPRMLMRYLKPKSGSTPFNLLDQDSIFFNSILLPNLQCRISEKRIASRKPSIELSLKEQPTICEGGDSLLSAIEGIHSRKVEPSCSKYSVLKLTSSKKLKIPKKRTSKVKHSNTELPVSVTSSQRVLRRGRIRRHVTPMPEESFNDPKNHLLKTILVGIVQISIFLVMIMAITYPDIKC